MLRFLNDLHGIVWATHGNRLEIQLPRGGKISAPNIEGIHIGDHVAFLMDIFDRHVTHVMLKEVADEQVERGSNHVFDVACRNTLIKEENNYAGKYTEPGDVFWCPELA